MGFKTKSGKYFANPAIGRQHDKDEAARSSAPARDEHDSEESGDHGPVHKVEIHHPDGKDNPSPGQHHVVSHHADGHEEPSDHASAEEAHAHAGEQMEVGDHQLGDADEEEPGGEEAVCPECGTAMQGGSCPECGYSADKNAIAGSEEEDAGDHEYR